MNKVVDFDVSGSEIDLVFEVTSLLEGSRPTIIEDITPFVSRFLEEESIFKGPFSLAFDERFEEIIKEELKNVILNNFEVNPEQALYLVEMMELMGILDLYLDKDDYIA